MPVLLAVAAGLTLALVAPTPPADAAPQKGKGKGKAKGQPQPAIPARPQAATPANTLKVAKGFKVELLYSVPKDEQGSWVNLCVDPKGRLIVSDQYGGLFRVTPPPLGQTAEAEDRAAPRPTSAMAQGLLWAFDSLYVVVNRGKKYESGLYRVTDTERRRHARQSGAASASSRRRRRARPARHPARTPTASGSRSSAATRRS